VPNARNKNMNKARFMVFLTVVLICGLILLGINNPFGKKTQHNAKIKVVTSFYPLYFFASNIGLEKAEVTNITPAGIEPHDYEMTLRDMSKISESQMLVINGLLEPWSGDIGKALEGKNIILVKTGHLKSEAMQKETSLNNDPHNWLSIDSAKLILKAITDGYIDVDQDNSQFYLDNYIAMKSKLDVLAQKYKDRLGNCKKRDFIVSHDAFSYLAKENNLEQISISGLSPESEPSIIKLKEIISFAGKKEIRYIFFESLVSPKLSEMIAEEIKAKTMILDPLEGISEQRKTKGDDYFSIMEKNLDNLIIALECQ
jgi:zinc transport system substrate-binding protein